MGFVLELVQLMKMGMELFVKIVREDEQALYIDRGVVLATRVKWEKETLQEIRTEEKIYQKQMGGLMGCLMRAELPKEAKNYRKDFLGRPRHPKRYVRDKVLHPGLYPHIPLIQDIYKETTKETVLNAGFVTMFTADEHPRNIALSCNVRYEVLDLYRAVMKVNRYPITLADHTMSILFRHCLGKPFDFWVNVNQETGKREQEKLSEEKEEEKPLVSYERGITSYERVEKEIKSVKKPKDYKETTTIGRLELEIEEDLRKLATNRWGIKIYEVYFTDISNCKGVYILRQEAANGGYNIQTHINREPLGDTA